MAINSKFYLLIIFCWATLSANAQKDASAKNQFGDPAPPLRVREWIKGNPVEIEKGNVYVVEFWATWCGPCIAAMPHLSKLARKYRGKVNFAAIDVYEAHATKTHSTEEIKAFVNAMGRRMDFNVAAEDTNSTIHEWLDAYDQESIPATFVVGRNGSIAWIGHPDSLAIILKKIMSNNWDAEQALSKRDFTNKWGKADIEIVDKARHFQGRGDNLGDIGHPDSILAIVDSMVKKRPDLKYAPWTASYTFSSLLLSNPQKAYEFGKQVMVTSTYCEPAWNMIIYAIEGDSRKVNMTPDIYRLGAECYQAEIDHIARPELYDMAKKYREMADWYRLAGDKSKSIKAEKKAIKYYRRSGG